MNECKTCGGEGVVTISHDPSINDINCPDCTPAQYEDYEFN